MNMVLPNIALASTEIWVFSMACLILLVDLILLDRNRYIVYLMTQFTLFIAVVMTVEGMSIPNELTFSSMYIHDSMASILKLMMYVLLVFVFAYSRDYLRDRNMYRGEYFVLGLFGLVGMMVIASASHFLTLYLGLELMSLSLYAMTAFRRDSAMATEAAMKYFVLGAMASGMLLYGMSMLYGVTGSLQIDEVRGLIAAADPNNMPLIFGLVFVVAALAFKLGAVPFHMWVPDVYHGAPSSVTLYISTAPKLAAFAMVMRLLVGGLDGLSSSWQDMLIILSILSMGIGNIIAIAQTNLKRMLAYSAISHMGFLLLGVLSASNTGYSASMVYIITYSVMSLGAFGLITVLSRKGYEAENLDDYKGLNQRNPWYAFLMLVLMFSMAGVPPTAGFYAKLLVIQSVIHADLLWVAIVAVLMAVIGVFYYIRVVKLMYFDEPTDSAPLRMGSDAAVLMSINVLVLIGIMPWIGTITDICTKAINSIG